MTGVAATEPLLPLPFEKGREDCRVFSCGISPLLSKRMISPFLLGSPSLRRFTGLIATPPLKNKLSGGSDPLDLRLFAGRGC